MCIASALTGVIVVIYSFAGYEPKYRCRIPYCDKQDGTYFNQDGTFPQYVKEGMKEFVFSVWTSYLVLISVVKFVQLF